MAQRISTLPRYQNPPHRLSYRDSWSLSQRGADAIGLVIAKGVKTFPPGPDSMTSSMQFLQSGWGCARYRLDDSMAKGISYWNTYHPAMSTRTHIWE